MKNFLALALMALSLATSAQQLTISASSSDGLVANSVGILGTDNLFVGQVNSSATYAFAGRYNDFGPVWTMAILDTIIPGMPFVKNSSAKNKITMPNGDIIIVGSYEDDAFVARLDQNGTTLWAKIFVVANNFEVFEGVTVDPLGTIYVVGTQTASNGLWSREIYAALSSGGTILTLYRADPRVGGAYHSAKAVFYMAGVLYIVGQTDYTGSVGGLSNKTVTITRLDPLNFNVLGYQLVGTHSNETLLDAKANSDGIFFVFKAENDPTSRIIAWYRPAVFSVVATVLITGGPFSASPDFGGTLALDSQTLYLSGGAVESGVPKSYIMKVNVISTPVNNLVPVWGRMITPGTMANYSYATAAIAVGGEVTIVDANSGGQIQSTITSIASSGAPLGFYCNPPTPFTPGWNNYPMSSGGMGLTLSPLAYGWATTSFRPYQTVPDPCVSTLPVELITFTGEAVERTSVLRWSTGSEIGTSHFEIMRSSDGVNFEMIGEHTAEGGAGHQTSYEFVDDHPFMGLNYYRLTIVDDDGHTETSNTIALQFDGGDEVPFMVYPNPAVQGEPLSVTGAVQTVVVHDETGREVSSQYLGGKLSFEGKPGLYLVSAVSTSGTHQLTRVVIQ